MVQILIVVDDEVSLARSRQMLRAYRSEWKLLYANSAPSALETLRESPCDAILVDLAQSAHEDVLLLQHVKKQLPEAVRLLACSREEHNKLLRSMGPAHQYVPRPYDPEQFRRAVEGALFLSERLTRPGLKQLVCAVESLPSLPAIYVELFDELNSPDSSIHRVGTLISKDLAMSAKILQLINSPYFGCRVHVKDVGHAAKLLGLNALKPLVLTAGVFRKLESSRVPAELIQELLEHSLAVGSLAQRIAKECGLGEQDIDHALLGGILHDVGKLVLADHFGRDYADVRSAAAVAQCPLEWAENDQFQVCHADVGGYLLGLWGFPQTVIEAVAFHHEPIRMDAARIDAAMAVQIANMLIHEWSDAYTTALEKCSSEEFANSSTTTSAIERQRRSLAWERLVDGRSLTTWQAWARDICNAGQLV